VRNNLSITRLLQRYAAGAGGAHLLEVALREETQRLAGEDGALEFHRKELQRFAGHHLDEFHEGLFGAVKGLGALDFAGTFEKVRRADAALQELRRFQSALQDHHEAESTWNRMEAELALNLLKALPTLQIPGRLLELSHAFLEKCRPLESAVVSRVCRQLLDCLTLRDQGARERLSAHLETLRRDLAKVEPAGAVRLAEVERLDRSGYHELASRLTDDLKVELLGWRAQDRRGRRATAILAHEIGELALFAESLKQIFQNCLPDQAAGKV
jgi:hypothetical protein